jgi:hypothetical protein
VSLEKQHAKVTHGYSREMPRQIVEDLSLSSGASIEFGTSQAEHHLLVSVVDLPSETKKATHWSPFPAVVSCAD